MGGEARANQLSEELGMSGPVKKFLKFLLKKCGNCPFRIECWSGLFPDKGKLIMAYRKVFLCDGKYKGNFKATFDGKQVVKFIKNCAPCVYLEACSRKILDSDQFLGMTDATSIEIDDHLDTIRRCANCNDNEECWSEILNGLGFGWTSSPKIVKIMIGCKFKKKGD